VPDDAHHIDPKWYTRAFDALYPVVYAHRTVEAAEPEARGAARMLRLSSDDRLLDLCCGAGRHLVHLLRVAPDACGIDYSPALLERARTLLGPRAPIARADMRALPFSRAFDVVTSFFTSFGYFLDREENLRVAREIARVLRPGGRFLIDHVNAAHVVQRLEPKSDENRAGYRLVSKRWIDDARRVNKRIHIYADGRLIEEVSESVQLYAPDAFRDLLAEAGLRVEAFHGDFDGAPLDDAHPRMVAVGRSVAS